MKGWQGRDLAMLTGISRENQKISATPNTIAFCPICNVQLRPKCGAINIWHFAHTTKDACDPWYEPESDWHREWKQFIDNNHREVIITLNGEKHIADIVTGIGIIELQHSHLPFTERVKREAFYKNLIWIVHVKRERFSIRERPEFKSVYGEDFEKSMNVSFHWSYPLRWVIKDMCCPTFIDFDDDPYLLKIEKLKHLSPCRGYGKLVSRKDFYERYLQHALSEPYTTYLNEGRLFNV